MADDRKEFELSRRANARSLASDVSIREAAEDLYARADMHNYSYLWNWCGLPIIQTPDDIVAMQEILWNVQPDVVVELGIARGGSLIFYNSIMRLVGKGRIIGVDLDIRPHNRDAIESHHLADGITMIEGSSTDSETFAQVRAQIDPGEDVTVILDSDHTHGHVLGELRLYSPLVTPGQFLIVTDTVVERIPEQSHRPRPWGKGNNPMTAMKEFLGETDAFEPDEWINSKLLLTSSPGGYLRRIK